MFPVVYIRHWHQRMKCRIWNVRLCESSLSLGLHTSKSVIILLIGNSYFNFFTQWETVYLWYTPPSITYSTHKNDLTQDSELNNAGDSEREGRCVGKWGSWEKNEISVLPQKCNCGCKIPHRHNPFMMKPWKPDGVRVRIYAWIIQNE